MSESQAPPARSPRTARVLLGCSVLVIGFVVVVGVLGLVLSVQTRKRESELDHERMRWSYAQSDAERAFTSNQEQLAKLKVARTQWEAELALAMARKAAEGLKVCNYTSAPTLDVAYVTRDISKGAWMGHGWYKVNNGECNKLLDTIEGSFVYLYASAGPRQWGGDQYFCTTPAAFTLMEPGQGSCVGGTFKGFSREIPQNNAFTWSLYDG